MKWISEADALPKIAQPVLFMAPRQAGDFWDISVSCLLAAHEAVVPRPVKAGDRWPVDYYWASERGGGSTSLVTGNGWWASLHDIELPPGAAHRLERGFTYIAQPVPCFIPQKS